MAFYKLFAKEFSLQAEEITYSLELNKSNLIQPITQKTALRVNLEKRKNESKSVAKKNQIILMKELVKRKCV